MYRRRRTLFDHQELACEALGFHPLIEAQRRALLRISPVFVSMIVVWNRFGWWGR
jgi:hypothetical protein